MRVLVINGPNLNLLGEREPEIYGHDTIQDCIDAVKKELPGIEVSDFQSNSENEIIDCIQQARGNTQALIINAGAFTHYSYAIRDALSMFDGIKIEVHLSNPHSREEFRHTSVISGVVTGVVAGFKKDSYTLAGVAVSKLLSK
jgi:3-dehydroquinate dehydratase-2